MGTEVFISHSSRDQAVARRACDALEASGLTCWIAPRDIPASANYAEAIMQGLANSRLMVLILTPASAESSQVMREVERAVGRGITILTVRMASTQLSPGLEYFLSLEQWLEADPSRADWHERLVGQAHRIIRPGSGAATPDCSDSSDGSDTYRVQMEAYRHNLAMEMQNNLVLELYDKYQYQDLCIQPQFVATRADTTRTELGLDHLLTPTTRAALLGDPGSGKTTALRLGCLQVFEAPESLLVPVYVSLSSLSLTQGTYRRQSIPEFLDGELAVLGGPTLSSIASHGQRPFLFLDGWDELPDENTRSVVKRFLLTCEHPFIVASRQEAQRTLPPVDRLFMKPLDRGRIREFMDARFERNSQVRRFLRWLDSQLDLAELARNPLNLSLMGIAFSEMSATESVTRTEMYGRALEAILRKHHHPVENSGLTRFSDLGVSIRDLESLFRLLAYETTIAGRGRFFSAATLENAIARRFPAHTHAINAGLLGNLGIIRDRRGGQIEFFHLWYQEFFAAQHVIETATCVSDLRNQLENSHLFNSLPFVIGLQGDRDLALELLLEIPIQSVFVYCRAIPEGRFSQNQLRLLVNHVIDHGRQRRPRMPVRIELAPAIAGIGGQAVSTLLEMVQDPSLCDYTRRTCLEALASLQPGPELNPVLQQLLRTEDLGLLWHVVEHVGNRRMSEALKILTDYASHPDPIVRGDSIWALSQITDRPVTISDADLGEILACLSGADSHLQGHALRTLGRLEQPRAVPALRRHLAGRGNAYRWIVPEAAAQIEGPEALDLLEVALADQDPTVVAASLCGLAQQRNAHEWMQRPSLYDAIESQLDRVEWIAAQGATLGELARHLVNLAERADVMEIHR